MWQVKAADGTVELETCEYCQKEEEEEAHAEAEGAVPGRAAQVEKRKDTDGKAYSKKEFLEFYGAKAGLANWRCAKKEVTNQRWTKNGEHAVPMDDTPADKDLNAVRASTGLEPKPFPCLQTLC